MKHRVTIETLASGQPAPYADTIHHVRVSFERSALWLAKKGELEPEFMTQEWVRARLPGLGCGYVDGTPDDPWATKLDWLKPIDAEAGERYAKEHQLVGPLASIWEFQTSTRFTD